MRVLILIFCWLLIPAAGLAQGTLNQTVFPFANETANGNTADRLFSSPSERIQWFRSSYLSQVWSNPVLISGIAFRVDEIDPPMDAIIPRVEISFATSQAGPREIAVWATAAGADARIVFADSAHIQSPGGTAGPNSFGIRFEFQEPFYYDPHAGNLVFRVQTIGVWTGGRRIDAQGFGGFDETPVATAGYTDFQFPNPAPIGLTTQLTWASVPEPNLLGAILEIAVLIGLTKRKS